jgi:hypothetical protein
MADFNRGLIAVLADGSTYCAWVVDGDSFISATCAKAGINTKAMLFARSFFIRYSFMILFSAEANLTRPGKI